MCSWASGDVRSTQTRHLSILVHQLPNLATSSRGDLGEIATRLSGGSGDLKLSSCHHSHDLVDAHTAWNHLDSLKWAQMVPNTRYCLIRHLGPLYLRTTQIGYIRMR